MERQITERIELPNQEKIRTLGEKGKLQGFRNAGSGHDQTSEDEREKKKKKVPQKNEKISVNQALQ